MPNSGAPVVQPSPPIMPLRVGDAVPDFTARSTHGMVQLFDFRGRWLVLFSHPADFTPVCTSEFVALARQAPRFAKMGCALLGHSVDSLFSHLAWVRAIRDDLGVTVPFPILEDPTLEIGRAFGMLPPDMRNASTVRSVYFIDPDGRLAASTAYPVSVGRSVEEMLRMLAALQRTHGRDVMTPEGWQPGDPVLAAPGFTAQEALAGEGATSWYYRMADEA